jgi:hypothetical protein
LSAPQLQSRTCAGLPSESQKSLLAEDDGAVHITPTAKAAAAPLTEAINTLVFMLGSLSRRRRPLLPLVALAE